MKAKIVSGLAAILAIAALSGCTASQQGAVGGAAVGAIAGQAIGGDTESTLIGAAIGGVGGAIAGELVGRQANGNCVYQRADGSQFIARCPS
jgi:outer membrane lipoprotein SlyB